MVDMDEIEIPEPQPPHERLSERYRYLPLADLPEYIKKRVLREAQQATED